MKIKTYSFKKSSSLKFLNTRTSVYIKMKWCSCGLLYIQKYINQYETESNGLN